MTIPLLLTTKGYQKKDFYSDLLAGLVVTAIAVPEVMGIATMAGVPVQMGLYSLLLAPVIFALFGVSRRLIVGADSATAVLLAGGAGLIAVSGTNNYIQAVLLLSLLSALFLALIGVFKFTFLADLISRPVMVGFLAGVGCQLIITKLPDMLGIPLTGSPIAILSKLPGAVGQTNGIAVTIAILTLGIILLLWQSRVPGPFIALIAASLFGAGFNVSHLGVKMVGALPAGLPNFHFPLVPLGQVTTLIPAALSIAIVILAQSAAVARSNAEEHDERPNVRQDTIALSAAGVVSALTGGLAINASPPRTLAADTAGMRSQVASITMSACVAVLLLFAGPIFRYVPVAALAAIVCAMGIYLVRARELAYLAEHHHAEFIISVATLIGVIIFGVFTGIIIGITFSLIERLRREYHPTDTILLRDGVLSDWAKERVVGLKPIPDDTLVFGFDASLFFENSQYFGHQLRKAIRGAEKPIRRVIIDTSAMDDIDYTAVEALKQLYRQLSTDGIRLGFSHVSPHLMEQFEDYGVIDLVGESSIFTTLRSAIEYVPPKNQSVIERVKKLHLPEGDYVVVGGAVMDVLNLRDSSDVDIVVTSAVYHQFIDKPYWHETVAAANKIVYTKNGIHIMRSWIGRNVTEIKRSGTFTQDSVLFMSPEQLIQCKHSLNRRKDQADITLLKSQIARNR